MGLASSSAASEPRQPHVRLDQEHKFLQTHSGKHRKEGERLYSVMTSAAINVSRLLQSLVAPPKGVPAKRHVSSAPVDGSCGVRGKQRLEHIHSMTYPMSLVEADTRSAAPISVSAGLRKREASAAKAVALLHRSSKATPERISACAQAKLAADAALESYHETDSAVFGDEDGRLQEVV